eukprot:5235796-Pyramimonas_sp.AAC.1
MSPLQQRSTRPIIENCPYTYHTRVLRLQCHYCKTTARVPTLAQHSSYSTAAKALHLEATSLVITYYSGVLLLFQYYRAATKHMLGYDLCCKIGVLPLQLQGYYNAANALTHYFRLARYWSTTGTMSAYHHGSSICTVLPCDWHSDTTTALQHQSTTTLLRYDGALEYS